MAEEKTPFEKYTKRKRTKLGYSIECVKGLWGVTAPNVATAEREAKHYFIQYYRDGEYNE